MALIKRVTHFVGDIHYLRPGLQRRMNRPCHSFLVVTCRASRGRRRYNTSYRSYRKARRLSFFFHSLHLFPLCARPAPLPLETLNDAWLWRVISPEFCCFVRTFLFLPVPGDFFGTGPCLRVVQDRRGAYGSQITLTRSTSAKMFLLALACPIVFQVLLCYSYSSVSGLPSKTRNTHNLG